MKRLARGLLPVALFGAGVWIVSRGAGLYQFAWSHPTVMLLGQFALLAAGALTRPWALALFWVFSGATAYALVERAASVLGGGLAAGAVSALAVALALALDSHVRGARPAADGFRQTQ